MLKQFFAILLAIPLMAGCKEQPQPDPNNNEDPTVDAEITITSAKEFDVQFAAGTVNVTFTCNTDWTVATMDDWVTANPASGAASTDPINVTISYLANPSLNARSSVLYIFAGKINKQVDIRQAGDPMVGAAEEIISGSTVLATNPNVEKFLTEVTYPDHDWSFTKVLDYYGGYNGKTYNENGQEDPNGKMFNWANEPVSDKPMSYSIRWKTEDMEEGKDMTLVLADNLGWKAETTVTAGSHYVNITNLVPNDAYTYKVTAASGKVLAEGNFTTTGHLHQVYFSKACRNGRDLGGWKTLDGKTIKYRKVYRGGRMQSETVNAAGKLEIKAEGIGAQLDLRGKSDVLSKPCIDGFAFCAPSIEEGGTSMLKKDAAKTAQCFKFVVDNVKAGKGVYFHCSLGRDRTGTLDILLLGLLGVPEGDIGKAYEVTYFSGIGYSVSSSEKSSNPTPIFKNTRKAWVYSDVVPYFWDLAKDTPGGTFAEGVEKYLLEVAKVEQSYIDDFRALMLE